MKSNAIFAVGCVIFALVSCHSSKPAIVQSAANITIDTLFLRDTSHVHSTEKTLIREIVYRDTALKRGVRETLIIRDKNEKAALQASRYRSQMNDSIIMQKQTAPNHKKNNFKPLGLITLFIVVFFIGLIVFFILAYLLKKK